MEAIDTADLVTLNFARLVEKDSAELDRLLRACQDDGFFYLDLAHSSEADGTDHRVQALSIAKDWFDCPTDQKLKYRQDSVTKGYKPPGTLTGVLKNEQDGFENIKMPRDDFVKGNDFLPEDLKKSAEIFRQDLYISHTITTSLLSCISDVLKPMIQFEHYHRSDMSSQSTMMYFRYLKQSEGESRGTGHNMHTDLGTLTLLYSEQWGLQVYCQKRATWAYVVPKPGLYVVNVGDALRFLSGKQLLSALHRVVPVPGQETSHRYSSAYFLRPHDEAKFLTSEGTLVSALDWHDIKYDTFKASHMEQEKNTILTGGVLS